MSDQPKTELQAAEMIRDGLLPAGWRYANSHLFPLRITGTGISFRSKHDEFVLRDPDKWLTDEFVARCNGLPVIAEHPDNDLLNSEEYGKRVIGAIMLPYRRGDEIRGIARILDDGAAQMMRDNASQMSTSPAVLFNEAENELVEGEGPNGEKIKLLVEGEPLLLDHLAVIVGRGVWDKGEEPSGLATEEADMAEENGKLDEILSAVKGIAERVGSLEETRAADRANVGHHKKRIYDDDDDDRGRRRDGDYPGTPLRKHIADDNEQEFEGRPHERIAKLREAFEADDGASLSDKSRKFLDDCADHDDPQIGRSALKLLHDDHMRGRAQDDDDNRRRDSRRRRDAEHENPRRDPAYEFGTEIHGPARGDANHEWGLSCNPDPIADRRLSSEMANYQARADRIAAIFSAHAPSPMQGEKLTNYRRRLLRPFQQYSELYKKIDLCTLGTPELLHAAEEIIYGDAEKYGSNMQQHLAGTGVLREIKRRDETGRMISEFVGDPKVWLGQFSMPRRRVVKFHVPQGMQNMP
jgi:hypothetical protein